MALIIDGKREAAPGLHTECSDDHPGLALVPGKSCRMRRPGQRVTGIVIHTTKGIPGGADKRPQVILPGFGPHVDAAERCARTWSTDDRPAGAHLVVDHDGVVSCLADLQRVAAYHASTCNARTIGIEVYQGSGAELYCRQIDTLVVLVDFLTRRFGIQRQLPWPYEGRPLARLANGAEDFVGVWGHRDSSAHRGEGDPGNACMRALIDCGYEQRDVDEGEDRTVWRRRQAELRVTPDGIPGPTTRAALLAAGRPSGMWVSRPGD